MSRFLLLVSMFVVLWGAAMAQSPSVVASYKKVNGVPVRLIYANLNDPEVRVSIVSPERIGRAESVWSLLARSRPTAAVCGTYFSKTTRIPVGDIVIEGERVHFGGVGTAMCITWDNQVKFVRPPMHRSVDWSAYQCVLGAGPRLLQKGKISLYPPGEGFRDPRVYSAAPRTAVGITKHNKLIMAVTTKPVRLRTMAEIMKKLGAVESIAMDGGSSTCFYYRKDLSLQPRRQLTNLLVVYESQALYERAKPRLTPANKMSAK